MKMRRIVTILFLFSFMLFVISACDNQTNQNSEGNNNEENIEEKGNDQSSNDEPNNNSNDEREQETVTLKVAYPFNVPNFEARIVSMEEKLDNIKFEAVPYRDSLESLEEIFASEVRPDIFFSSLEQIIETDVALPLDDLIEEYNFDLDQLNQSLVQYIRTQDPEGRLLGLPDGASYFALYYNKEIFDMFGVPYPDPDEVMTWEELLDLSRELTAEREGVQYVGLEIGPGSTPGREMLYPLRQFAVNATDPETGEVLVTEDPAFKEYFEMLKEFYDIPGIYENTEEGEDLFAQKRAAMTLERNLYFERFEEGNLEYQTEMDMIAYPVWSDMPDTGPYLTTTPMIIANYTEHKEEAFEALLEYMSPDHQVEMLRPLASATVLNDLEVLEQVAADVDSYKDKNRSAFYALEPAKFEGLQSRWDKYVDFASAIRKIAEDDIDVNTALRELQEESEAKITDAQSQE